MSTGDPQFFTRWRPYLQAGKRHRSFIITSPIVEAQWNGFSRPILSVDVSGAKNIASTVDVGTANSVIAVSVVTWNPLDLITANIPNTRHYMIRRASSVGLNYLPAYEGQRLSETAKLYFWTAPADFGPLSKTSFSIEILANGLEMPFDIYGYVKDQEIPSLTLDYLLYTEDYPVDSDPIINANQFQIS